MPKTFWCVVFSICQTAKLRRSRIAREVWSGEYRPCYFYLFSFSGHKASSAFVGNWNTHWGDTPKKMAAIRECGPDEKSMGTRLSAQFWSRKCLAPASNEYGYCSTDNNECFHADWMHVACLVRKPQRQIRLKGKKIAKWAKKIVNSIGITAVWWMKLFGQVECIPI